MLFVTSEVTNFLNPSLFSCDNIRVKAVRSRNIKFQMILVNKAYKILIRPYSSAGLKFIFEHNIFFQVAT